MNAYDRIKEYYGTRCAERSGVPLINHIDEGLRILGHLGADTDTQDAFCIHPLIQADADLLKHSNLRWHDITPRTMLLAMEYRWRANNWLSDKVTLGVKLYGTPDAGNITAVRQMLIADKVQNYADFVQYHESTHPRATELRTYFVSWLYHLDVSSEQYKRLAKLAKL